MHTKSAQTHIFIKLFLLISLVFNHGLSLAGSSSAMAQMQAFATDDTLVICTGSEVKWISANIYFETGELVEVATPEHAPNNLHDTPCVIAKLTDSQKLFSYSSPSFQALVVSFIATEIGHQANLQTQHNVFKPVRAPPAL